MNNHCIIRKARELEKKKSTSALLIIPKPLTDYERDGVPGHFTCLLRNLYAGQEARIRTGHGIDRFQIGKGVHQGHIVSPCFFNLYAEYMMRNAGLEEAQTEIKISGRNINNFRYAGDTKMI